MRLNKAAVPVVFLGFALTGSTTAQEPEAARSNAQAGQKAAVAPVVQITAHTDFEITGALTPASWRVAFVSRKETPSRVVLRLELGDIVLDAIADFQEDTRTLDGHGHALSLDERAALRELSVQLERQLDPRNRDLSSHADLLLRVLSYWAEAPVGWPLKRQVVSAPVVSIVQPAADTSALASSCESENCVPGGGTCEQDSDSGIGLLSDPCVLATYSGIWHDASPDHCFCSETLQLGCNLNEECLGRCGPGCATPGSPNLTGAGVYSLDCAEHDRCCRRHDGCENPFDPQCGDEFRDAADDFLFMVLLRKSC